MCRFLSKTKQFDWIKELFILNEQNLIPLLTMNERKICTFLCKWEISVQNFEHFSFFFTCHMYKGVMFFF